MVGLGVSPAYAKIVEVLIHHPENPQSAISGPGPGGTWRIGCEQARCFFTFPVSITAYPKKPIEVCFRDGMCEGIFTKVASEVGTPPEVTSEILALYHGAEPFNSLAQQKGHTLKFKVPPHFKACTMYWNFYSFNGPTISGSFDTDAHQVGFSINAAIQNASGPRTWVHGFVEVFAKSDETYHGGSGCYTDRWSSQSHCPEEWPGGYGVFDTNCPGNPDPPHNGIVIEPFYKY